MSAHTTWPRAVLGGLFGVLLGAASPAGDALAQARALGDEEPGSSPAAEGPATVKPWTAPADLKEWSSGIKLGLQFQAGITGNPTVPDRGVNFGQLTTDLPNRPLLNQVLATAGRDIDPTATGYDFGFKFALLYGSDARIYHTLGVFDRLIHDRNQLAVMEATAAVRLPWLGRGIDVKAGIFPTPLGFEVMEPRVSPFYSHSYIFNYGLPFKHTGALAVAHVSDVLDLYFGITTGSNTSFGSAGDNNDRPAGLGGFGLVLAGGNLTVLALTHIGPESPTRITPFGNSALRYYNDVVVTYKASDKLSFTTEVNYVKDDGFRAEGYGAAQYVTYVLDDRFTFNARGEIWRDNGNLFVVNPNSNRDYANAQRGDYATLVTSPEATATAASLEAR